MNSLALQSVRKLFPTMYLSILDKPLRLPLYIRTPVQSTFSRLRQLHPSSAKQTERENMLLISFCIEETLSLPVPPIPIKIHLD